MPTATERRQSHGCHSVYKSAILTDDFEDPRATLKPLGGKRGGARGVGRGNGKAVGITKVALKKQKLGK